MKPNPITEAIGTLKLCAMHLNNPAAVPLAAVQAASAECIEHLEQLNPGSLQLMNLYTALLAILPHGWLPHVSITPDLRQLFGVVITDEAGNIAVRATGKTIEGIIVLTATQLGLNKAA